MTFDVGGADYEVVREHKLAHNGKPRNGLFDGTARLIKVDAGIVREADVLSVLRHEHRHAWEYETGLCQGCPESRAQLGVVAHRTFERDWRGLAAFMAIAVTGNRVAAARRSTKGLAVCCHHCGYVLADGRCPTCE